MLAESIGFRDAFGPSRIPWIKAALFSALGAAVLSILLPYQILGLVLLGLSCALVAALVILGGVIVIRHHSAQARAKRWSAVITADKAAKFFTTLDGVVLEPNAAAKSLLGERATIAELFAGISSQPDVLVAQLLHRAKNNEAVQDVIVNRHARHDLRVSRIASNLLLWDVRPETRDPQVQDTLGHLPLITLSEAGRIEYLSPSARAFLDADAGSLDALLFDQRPKYGAPNTLRGKDGRVSCFLHVLSQTPTHRQVIVLPMKGRAIDKNTLAFEDLPVATLQLDQFGVIKGGNRAVRSLLGREDIRGLGFGELVEGLGRPMAEWLREVLEGSKDSTTEFLKLRGQNNETFVQATLAMSPHAGSDQILAVLSDATELKSLENQFVQSQKMQAIGQLAGGIAHDFNNLLTAISGHCDLMLLRHDRGDEDFADLTQIAQNANRAASLVGQLLGFSRKQTLQPEICHLPDTLSDFSHLLNRLVGANVEVEVTSAANLAPIRVDRQKFEQIIMNLVVNARDAMEEGGIIKIQSENVTYDTPLLRDKATVAPGDYVSVKVQDTGKGIPAHLLGKIFEPFYTTKPIGKGTGLGLSMVYGIVKQSGGFVFADSAVDEGTCFTLLFPAIEAARVEPDAKPANTLPKEITPVGAGRILLVEDEAPVRAFAAKALRIKGLTVLEAGHAADALDMLQNQELHIDLIITDVIMPGLDGPTWIKEARQTRPDTPVIFISGYADDTFADELDALDDASFLSKPFSLAQLTATVDQILLGGS